MSLLVDVFVTDETGERVVLDSPAGGLDLAGHERTRTLLWGSAAVRELGARHLPVLATEDLWIEPGEIEGFLAECELVRANIPAIAARTDRREDYIASRLDNIIGAARRARELGGGVVIW
ncbi:hypothetical protein [Actinomadura sp. 21ATH]|uniref:hypothetical protein n=1 Tax=Actinomadura sp. 21ATH TaxID=1735444 RepID=UPI0035C08330